MTFYIGSTTVIDSNAKIPWASINAPSGIIKHVTTQTLGDGTNVAICNVVTFSSGTLAFTFTTDCRCDCTNCGAC